MNGQVFPLFEQAHILRTPMLTELRDYAYEYGQLDYEGFSDGIVSGCRITSTEDTITLNRGTIRYRERLYLIVEPVSLVYVPTEEWTMFKLAFKDEVRDGGYIYREVEAGLTDNFALRPEEIELCRFKLKAGARLRMQYVDFFDRNTEFDTVNVIYAPHAAYGKSSISPEITRAFALAAVPYNAETLDTVFCMEALNAKGALGREAIILYAAAKLKKEFRDYSNKEIFDMLCAILTELKGNGARQTLRAARKRRQLIVD